MSPYIRGVVFGLAIGLAAGGLIYLDTMTSIWSLAMTIGQPKASP